MSGIDIASNSALLSVADKLDMQNIFLAAIAGKDNGLPINDWGSVQAIVRAGLAPKVFAVGDQLSCNHETYGELVWDIVGFDHDIPTDKNLTHSMTLMLHNPINKSEFDSAEYLFFANEELPAGVYSFSLPEGYSVNFGGSENKKEPYSFSIENSVPARGYLTISWGDGTDIKTAHIKSFTGDNTQIETAEVVDLVDGATELENIGSGINDISRARFGSNVYMESAIRKWLNSSKTAGNWWSPSNVFDKVPPYAKNAGFLNGLDKDFVSAIGKVKKKAYDDVLKNGKQLVTFNDYMFLLSSNEVYADWGELEEGTAYEYFKTYSDNTIPSNNPDGNRIKYYNDAAIQWNLRTPGFVFLEKINSLNCAVRYVSEKGACSNMSYAYTAARGIVPACCII